MVGHTGRITWLAATDQGSKQLAASSVDGTVRLWDVSTAQCTVIIDAHQGAVYGIAFSPDGRVLASGGADGSVRLWAPFRLP
jgi:WD40 repeat protein